MINSIIGMIECKKCGNKETGTLYQHDRYVICRKCISYGESRLEYNSYEIDELSSTLHMDYELTVFQKECSHKVMNLAKKYNVMVEAVCGAGKTEVMLEFVRYCLIRGFRIGWAIPRRQVVLELCERMQNIFRGLKITPVCEGYTENLEGDLVMMTTHQLFRYQGYFDYLIIDEVDAFPYSNNETLKGIAKKAYKKGLIYLSATTDEVLDKEIEAFKMKKIRLDIRPSLKMLPVPKEVRGTLLINYVRLITMIKQCSGQCLVFAPTIKQAKQLSRLLNTSNVTSKSKNQTALIDAFRTKDIKTLVTTTILERGVTFKEISVIVFQADHPVFTASSLIQIAGRVGRGISSYEGECVFLTSSKNVNVLQCIQKINTANASAQVVLKKYHLT